MFRNSRTRKLHLKHRSMTWNHSKLQGSSQNAERKSNWQIAGHVNKGVSANITRVSAEKKILRLWKRWGRDKHLGNDHVQWTPDMTIHLQVDHPTLNTIEWVQNDNGISDREPLLKIWTFPASIRTVPTLQGLAEPLSKRRGIFCMWGKFSFSVPMVPKQAVNTAVQKLLVTTRRFYQLFCVQNGALSSPQSHLQVP